MDYETAAYYDTYVEACLYKDGSQVTCASQTGSPGASATGGYINAAIVAGSHYQIQTDHYLIAPFAYVSGGVNYYYNPYGYGYASNDGDYLIDDSSYWSAGRTGRLRRLYRRLSRIHWGRRVHTADRVQPR